MSIACAVHSEYLEINIENFIPKMVFLSVKEATNMSILYQIEPNYDIWGKKKVRDLYQSIGWFSFKTSIKRCLSFTQRKPIQNEITLAV